VCSLLLFAGTSVADSFNLAYYDTATGGQAVNVVANLQVANDGNGQYTVTGITGYYDGHKITGLTSDSNYNWDNLLFFPSSSGHPSFDLDGLLFNVAGGLGSVNLCSNPGCSENNTNSLYTSITGPGGGGYVFTDVTVSIADYAGPGGEISAPEPGSFVLMGTGLIGLVGALRRKLRA